MLLNAKKIINLPVFTKNGSALGKVIDFEIDIDSHLVRAYFVRSGFLKREIIISRTQVISVTLEKMVVEDVEIKEWAADTKKEKKTLSAKAEPALPSSLK